MIGSSKTAPLWHLALLLGCAPTPATPPPAIPQGIVYYDVTGESEAALRASLDRERAITIPGVEHDGYTRWNVTWQFSFASSNPGCRLSSASTKLTTQVFLPRWSKTSSPSPPLIDKWARYTAALAAHEDGHVKIARDAETAVQRAISEIPLAKSCSDLERQLNSTARQTIEQFKERELQYDRMTDHGASQGVRFP